MKPERGSKYNMLTCLDHDDDSRVRCLWECDCGNRIWLSYKGVKSGVNKSCGCAKQPRVRVYPGEVYGNLTAIRKVATKTRGRERWLWECACGNKREVDKSNVINGLTTSCGCALGHSNQPHLLQGKKFGYWEVLDREPFRKNKLRYWACKCTLCGEEREVAQASLLRGESRSCHPCSLKNKSQYKGSIEKKVNRKYTSYRYSANKRGLTFELTMDLFASLVNSPCYYCGAVGANFDGINGIDRIDSSKGYTDDNVLPCCVHCNKAKSALSIDNFLQLVKKIYEKHCK